MSFKSSRPQLLIVDSGTTKKRDGGRDRYDNRDIKPDNIVNKLKTKKKTRRRGEREEKECEGARKEAVCSVE